MAEMLLVNPLRRKRRRKGGGRRRGRRRAMTALQRRYFGKGHAPVRRSRKRRRSRSVALAAPRAHRRRSHRRRRSMRVTRVRRNPIRMGSFNLRGFLRNTLMPAGVGALGAIGVDVAMAYVNPYLPVSLQSGIAKTGVKIAGAVAVGMVAGKVMGRQFGENVTAGAITVTLYDLIKGYVATSFPTLALSEYNMGWISPSPQMGEYVGRDPLETALPGLGEYVGEFEPGGAYQYGG